MAQKSDSGGGGYRKPATVKAPELAQEQVRRIKERDDAVTVPDRVTFPVGSFISTPPPAFANPAFTGVFSNPSTAAAGALGAASATLPKAPPVGYGPNAHPATSVRIPAPAVNGPPVGYGGNFPSTPPRTNVQNPELDVVHQRQKNLDYMAATLKLPVSLSAADAAYMAQQGYNMPELAANYTYNPATRQYVLNQQGAAINAGAQVQTYGQYVDSSGNIRSGTTPFGTNAAGQRLDASGQVWNPATATRDIYGGQFIPEGTVKWERNRAGRLIKVKYGSGGRKRIIAGGRGQSRDRTPQPEAASYAPVQYAPYTPYTPYAPAAQAEDVLAVANSFLVNFNAAVG